MSNGVSNKAQLYKSRTTFDMLFALKWEEIAIKGTPLGHVLKRQIMVYVIQMIVL